jgi:tRNA pseudouridine55 synthase
MHGAFLINKPKNITSFDVIRRLQRLFPGVKMGHLGTLDPMATGLLPVFLGKATRLIRYFNESDKTYEAVIELGKSSDTFDREGKIRVHSEIKAPETGAFATILRQFLGTHFQIQPPFSAIKRYGRPAYALAHAGKPVSLGKRQVTIHEIREISYQYPLLSFTVHCSSGTYIRSLAHELGEKLGTGALLKDLKRTAIGLSHISQAVGLDVVSEKHLIPLEELIMSWIPDHQLLSKEKKFLIKRIMASSLVNCISETHLQRSGVSA